MPKYLRGELKREVQRKYSDYINSSAIDKEESKWKLLDVFNTVVYKGSLKDIKGWYKRIKDDFPMMSEEVLYKAFDRSVVGSDMDKSQFKRIKLLYSFGVNLDNTSNFFMFMTPVRSLINKSHLYDWVFEKEFNPNIPCEIYGSFVNRYLSGFCHGDFKSECDDTKSNQIVQYNLAERLLKKGADINVRSKEGNSVANIAISEFHKNYDKEENKSHSKIFDLMMAYGFVPDYKVEDGNIIISLDTYCNSQRSNPTYNWISHGENMKIYKAFEDNMKILAERHYLGINKKVEKSLVLPKRIRL